MSVQPNRVNILFIASEADPFVKVGGLGDVAGSLPLSIHKLSDSKTEYDIRLVLPLYGVIKNNYPYIKKVADFQMHTGRLTVKAEVYSHDHQGMTVYFIAGNPIKENDPIYGTNFVSDAEKFIFFSLACLELPRVLKWKIDILHANDWHTAIAIHQLAGMKTSRPGYTNIKSILTLHNLPFMGSGSEEALTKFGIEPAEDPTLPIWARTIPLPMGLASADYIVAVSPTYASEVLTPEFGCGLEFFFSKHQDHLCGILNGIDYSIWNPSTDQFIYSLYDPQSVQRKNVNKKALQKEMGFKISSRIPLVIMISRMDPQKGVDLAIDALRSLVHLDWQAVILGSGDPVLEKSAKLLETDYPEKIRAKVLFDPELSHRLYAGADILLMPSRYEPCGLSQLIAIKYGTIPVVRTTGGLKDTIVNALTETKGYGFIFPDANSEQTAGALFKALEYFKSRNKWGYLMQNAMSRDFSWTESAQKYCTLYQKLIQQ